MAIDWLTVGEFLTPLVVALFAVWLSSSYERRLADRRLVQESHARTRSALRALINTVQLTEILSYATFLLREAMRFRLRIRTGHSR